MDDAMLLPLEERQRAQDTLDGLEDRIMGYDGVAAEGPTPELLNQKREAEKELKRSQAYVALFSNKQKVAFFWNTEEIARRYIQIRNSLIAFSARSREMVGQEAIEVHFNRSYSHSSPFGPEGQRELFSRFENKVHSFWASQGTLEDISGDLSIRNMFGLRADSCPHLRWYPIDMADFELEDVYSTLNLAGALLNPEPFTVPRAVYPFPPNAVVSQAERLLRATEHREYERQVRAMRNAVQTRDFKGYGLLDVILNADGLVFHRANYPKAKTPILTWKQIRSVIPKGKKRKTPTAIAHNPDAKRKLVIVQRKEE